MGLCLSEFATRLTDSIFSSTLHFGKQAFQGFYNLQIILLRFLRELASGRLLPILMRYWEAFKARFCEILYKPFFLDFFLAALIFFPPLSNTSMYPLESVREAKHSSVFGWEIFKQ